MTGTRVERVVADSFYSLVLPPGWARLNARGNDRPGVANVARALVGPSEQLARTRAEVESTLADLVDEGAANGLLDMYIPVEPILGQRLGCTFAVALFKPEESDLTVEDVLLALAAGDETATVVELGGSVALRTCSTTMVDADFAMRLSALYAQTSPGLSWGTGTGPSCRRSVNYIVGVPTEELTWLSITGVVLGDAAANDFVDAQIDLMDAILGSFAWVGQ